MASRGAPRRGLTAIAVAVVAVFLVAPGAGAVFDDAATVGANTFGTATLLPPAGLGLSGTCGSGVGSVVASWSASPSGFASGYRLQRWRGGVLESDQVVAGVATTTAADGPLVPGVAYEYRVFAEFQNWTSSVVTQLAHPGVPGRGRPGVLVPCVGVGHDRGPVGRPQLHGQGAPGADGEVADHADRGVADP